MKKAISLVLVLALLALALVGCGNKEGSLFDQLGSTTGTTVGDPTGSEEPDDGGVITEVRLEELVRDNAYCNAYVFGAGTLPPVGEPVQGNLCRVDPDMYESYQEFADYLQTVYTADYVDYLLTDYPEKGNPLYVNLEGQLYINMDLAAARGYNVNWEYPAIRILEVSETACRFTAGGIMEEPGDPPVQSEHLVEVTAVYENGRWLLIEMFH